MSEILFLTMNMQFVLKNYRNIRLQRFKFLDLGYEM